MTVESSTAVMDMENQVGTLKEQSAIFTTEIANMKDRFDRISEKLDALRAEVHTEMTVLRESLTQTLSEHYVRHEEFEPVKNAVYGTIAIIGMAFIGAIIVLVLKT